MIFAISLTLGFILVLWLVFFKFKWLKFSMAWAIVSAFVFLHVLLIFVIGMRFVTPYATDAKVIQHTIQLVPRLPEPTLVTAVLVEPNMPVKKGQPLFQFDRRPYEYKVKQLEATLAQAKQNVLVLKADVAVTAAAVPRAESELEFAKIETRRYRKLAQDNAGSEQEAQRWETQVLADEAAVKEAVAQAERARLKYESEIDGVNTTVAAVQAELDQARYYLDNTTLVAPEDGHIINLQVRPGMVSGDLRFGAIAAFIVDTDRYVLANFTQETLKYVKPGQPVEVALDLYPGQIFPGKVDAIWWASGEGQLLPSGNLPKFSQQPPQAPQGLFAVKIYLDGPDQTKFPIGAQGRAAIYTNGLRGGWAALRRVAIRTYTWLNWLYPLSF
jgi:multidrug resistance efflux pump